MLIIGYEIPSALRYEEKFIAGLTGKQLAYIAVGGMLSYILYILEMILEMKILFIMIISGITIAFSFFKMDEYIKDVSYFLSNKRQIGYLDKEAEDFLGIENIEKRMVYLRDGRRLAIVNCIPINIAVKSDDERKAIAKNFKEFFNSLDFPIQIQMRTVDTSNDLAEYFDVSEKLVRNVSTRVQSKKLLDAFIKYREFFENHMKKHAIKNRVFYVVIPYEKIKDIKKVEKQLDIRVKIIKEKLASVGIRCKRLSTNQLITLYSSHFEQYLESERDYLFPFTMFKKSLRRKKNDK